MQHKSGNIYLSGDISMNALCQEEDGLYRPGEITVPYGRRTLCIDADDYPYLHNLYAGLGGPGMYTYSQNTDLEFRINTTSFLASFYQDPCDYSLALVHPAFNVYVPEPARDRMVKSPHPDQISLFHLQRNQSLTTGRLMHYCVPVYIGGLYIKKAVYYTNEQERDEELIQRLRYYFRIKTAVCDDAVESQLSFLG